jgi:predicted DNA binding CopG/RHH family protein
MIFGSSEIERALSVTRKVKTTKTITLQLPKHMLPLIKRRAKSMGLSLPAYCAELLRQELKRQGFLKY